MRKRNRDFKLNKNKFKIIYCLVYGKNLTFFRLKFTNKRRQMDNKKKTETRTKKLKTKIE